VAERKLNIIGELINNAYGRARNAFINKDLQKYQKLATGQVELGSTYLDINVDGTQQIQVKLDEMLSFLPELISAVQEVTDVPLCFDNPSIEYHKIALKHYDRKKGGRPILNSIAASREHLDEMIELVKEYDTDVIVMASEHFVDGASAQSLDPKDSHKAIKYFVERLAKEADRTLDNILADPGLAPVGADTYGLVNIGLDTMKLISADPDLNGIHMSVGLSNFAWGTPKFVRHQLERAYLTIAREFGLDFAIANPEQNPTPLPKDHPVTVTLQRALDEGRVQQGETQEIAGFRQAGVIMELCREADDDDWDD
jgi:cobalamin-dependent methionine synthase I